jgi:hypothetical protein
VETTSEQILNTVAWFSSNATMPAASSHDAAIATACDLIHALQHPSAAASLALLTDGQHAALQQLAEIFQSVTQPKATSTIPPGIAPLPSTNSLVTPVPRVVESSTPDTPTETPTKSTSVPRVPTDTPTAPTTYYHNRTANAGCRRQLHAKQAQATAQTRSPTTNHNDWTTVTRSMTRQERQSPCNSIHQSHTTITVHTANLITMEPTISTTTPITASIEYHATLPPHAYWTANAVVDPITGTALKYAQVKTGPDAKKWIHSAANEIGQLTEGV